MLVWVHFPTHSFSWVLTLNCFLLEIFIFPFCLYILLITQWMILWQYAIVDLAVILLGWLISPTLFCTCCSSFKKFPVLFWQSMSNVHLYSFHNVLLLIIEEEISLAILFLSILILITYLTLYLFIFPLCMSHQRCFRELYLSGKTECIQGFV